MNDLITRTTQAVGLLVLLALSASPAVAQFGLSGSAPQGSVANQLPLRGTEGQNGSVTATQAPIPGTTTSVNTLNTSIQVSGPYAGSTRSSAKMPFTGKISFLEAIQRGLDFNLGTEGMAQAMRQNIGKADDHRCVQIARILERVLLRTCEFLRRTVVFPRGDIADCLGQSSPEIEVIVRANDGRYREAGN